MLRNTLTSWLDPSSPARRTPTRSRRRVRPPALRMERLEDRTNPTTIVDATAAFPDATLLAVDGGNVLVSHLNDDPSATDATGSGVFDPFVRIHHQDSEEGYNTDYRDPGNPTADLLDDVGGASDVFNTTLALADLNTVVIDGVDYYHFRLDLGEPGNDASDNGLINLARLQFFQSGSNLEHHYDPTGGPGGIPSLGGSVLVYDMDANGDTDITLRDLTSGNGRADYDVFVRAGLFSGANGAYVYMYSAFGSPPPTADGTFEEWSAEKAPAPPPPPPPAPQSVVTIELSKFRDDNGDGTRNGTDANIAWTFTVVVGANSYPVETGTAASFDLNDDGDLLDPGDASFDGHVLSVQVLDSDLDAAGGVGWSVTEADVAGWTHTTPAGVTSDTSPAGALTLLNTSVGIGPAAPGLDPNLDFGNFENVTITGHKFYDANANGVDDDALVVEGVRIVLTVTSGPLAGNVYYTTTNAAGNFTFGDLDNADGDDDPTTGSDLGPNTSYTVSEVLPDGSWMQTAGDGDATLAGFQPYAITVGGTGVPSGGAATGNNFGNLCLGAGGGLTLGFWSNKNGQDTMTKNTTAVVDAATSTLYSGGMNAELAFLRNLNLVTTVVDKKGKITGAAAFNPTSYTDFRNWLLNASATNMAYMLSAQLAAMELNVFNGKVDPNALVYAGPSLGFMTISALMAAANTELGLSGHNLTLDGSPYRAYQEALKTALDRANNNLNFVHQDVCPVVYAAPVNPTWIYLPPYSPPQP